MLGSRYNDGTKNVYFLKVRKKKLFYFDLFQANDYFNSGIMGKIRKLDDMNIILSQLL